MKDVYALAYQDPGETRDKFHVWVQEDRAHAIDAWQRLISAGKRKVTLIRCPQNLYATVPSFVSWSYVKTHVISW